MFLATFPIIPYIYGKLLSIYVIPSSKTSSTAQQPQCTTPVVGLRTFTYWNGSSFKPLAVGCAFCQCNSCRNHCRKKCGGRLPIVTPLCLHPLHLLYTGCMLKGVHLSICIFCKRICFLSWILYFSAIAVVYSLTVIECLFCTATVLYSKRKTDFSCNRCTNLQCACNAASKSCGLW